MIWVRTRYLSPLSPVHISKHILQTQSIQEDNIYYESKPYLTAVYAWHEKPRPNPEIIFGIKQQKTKLNRKVMISIILYSLEFTKVLTIYPYRERCMQDTIICMVQKQKRNLWCQKEKNKRKKKRLTTIKSRTYMIYFQTGLNCHATFGYIYIYFINQTIFETPSTNLHGH